ncbi:tetratricopeptide repeat protein [soil metagenome]
MPHVLPSFSAAIAASLGLVLGVTSASADDRAPATPLSPTAAANQTAPLATAAPVPATAAERAAYDRTDPLSRSVFWGRQQEIDPTDPVAGVRLAQALREMGQYDQAAQTAQQILLTQPTNIEAMLEVGRAHIARGQGFYGIAALEQARDAAPQDWRPLSLLGVAYNQVRRADDARAAWNRGLQLSPDNPEILTNAAVALTAGGDPAGAEGLLRRAVAQPGASMKMRLNLALVLGLQGKTGEAEQIIRRDLPPEMAERNLQWLRDKTTAGSQMAASQTAGVAGDPILAAATARTWSSLQGQ